MGSPTRIIFKSKFSKTFLKISFYARWVYFSNIYDNHFEDDFQSFGKHTLFFLEIAHFFFYNDTENILAP